MKTYPVTVFQVTKCDIGRNGNTQKDIGKWCIVCCGVTYWRKTEREARELANYIK